nr:UDP-N-acetyl-D-mannosamine dehydrogenase [Desulfurococcales archaeon]
MLTVNRICVIGLGYVGLPNAVVFASRGYEVVGVDVDATKVEAVNSGRCYLREPGLDVLLRDVVSRG